MRFCPKCVTPHREYELRCKRCDKVLHQQIRPQRTSSMWPVFRTNPYRQT